MALSLHYYSYPFTLWYFHYLVKDMSNGILVFATIVLVMLNNTKHFTANINIFESSAIKLVTTVHNSLNNNQLSVVSCAKQIHTVSRR